MRNFYRSIGFAGFVLGSLTVLSATANAANRAPTISGSPPTRWETGSTYRFYPTASDADGQALTFKIQNMPSWAYFSSSSGKLAGTPTTAGVYGNIVISVTDGISTVSLPAFSINVLAGSNAIPVIGGTPATSVAANQTYSFKPTASDANGNTLSFTIGNKPSWAAFDAATGRLYGTPTSSNVGAYSSIMIIVTDGKASVSLPTFSITVTAANNAPKISGAPATAAVVGAAYGFQPSATDADGNTLTYSIANKPSWAAFSASTGRLSGTPTAAGVNSSIVISVSDGKASASLPAFSINVAAPNTAPQISGAPATTVPAGSAYNFQPAAVDAEKNLLAFSIQNKPTWASFSTVTGQLTGMPTNTQVGAYGGIVISVSDGKASTSLPAFGIQVMSTNKAPVISGAPLASVNSGVAYSFKPMATDADGDAITYSIGNKPAWANFDPATGMLSGTPSSADVATYSGIVISASDGKLSASLPAFAIEVTQIATGRVTLSWTPPVQNTDGTALTNLSGYRIHYGNSATVMDRTISINSAGIANYMVEDLSAGTWYFAIKAISSAGESDFSATVSKTI